MGVSRITVGEHSVFVNAAASLRAIGRLNDESTPFERPWEFLGRYLPRNDEPLSAGT
jgi:hypothetical protein